MPGRDIRPARVSSTIGSVAVTGSPATASCNRIAAAVPSAKTAWRPAGDVPIGQRGEAHRLEGGETLMHHLLVQVEDDGDLGNGQPEVGQAHRLQSLAQPWCDHGLVGQAVELGTLLCRQCDPDELGHGRPSPAAILQ